MSLICAAFKEDIELLKSNFEITEKDLKALELETSELAIPAINQLRYAGYHFMQAAAAKNESDIKEELHKALNHCQRARFDVIEIGLTNSLDSIRIFQDTYSGCAEVLEVISDYVSLLTEAQHASEALQAIPDESKNREDYYQKIEPYEITLKNVVKKLNVAKPLIAKKIKENNAIKKKEARRFTISVGVMIVIGIITIAITAIGLDANNVKKNLGLDNKQQSEMQEKSK